MRVHSYYQYTSAHFPFPIFPVLILPTNTPLSIPFPPSLPPSLLTAEKKTAVGVVQGNIDEAGELVSTDIACTAEFLPPPPLTLLPSHPSQLEQMDVEIHDMPVSVRPQLKQRLENYRTELKRIGREFVSYLPPHDPLWDGSQSIFSLHLSLSLPPLLPT